MVCFVRTLEYFKDVDRQESRTLDPHFILGAGKVVILTGSHLAVEGRRLSAKRFRKAISLIPFFFHL